MIPQKISLLKSLNDETKMTKSLIEEPPELELKDIPPHLEYAFLEETSKLPVIIAKDFKREEKDQLNSYEDIDDFVPIPRVSEKPLDSLDPISKTLDMTITNPLFDFDSEFNLNLDNPIFDIQNEESDESKTETIMEEVASLRMALAICPNSTSDATWPTRGCHMATRPDPLTVDLLTSAMTRQYEVAGRLANGRMTRVHGIKRWQAVRTRDPRILEEEFIGGSM
ncbi:hypothetical protein Tco_0277050 [Tanacetum coccineum]